MSTHKNLITLCLAAVFTLGLAACGGGGGGGGAPVTDIPDMEPDLTLAGVLMGQLVPEGIHTLADDLVEALGAADAADADLLGVDYPEGTTITVAGLPLTCGVGPCSVVDNEDGTITTKGTIWTAGYMPPPSAGDIAEQMKMATAQALGVAKAIMSPMVAASANGVPAVAMIERSTEGMHTITLMNTDGGDFDPEYAASEMATPEIASWHGETQMRTPDKAPMENAVIYTDIKSATPQKLVHESDGEPIPTVAGNVIVLADDELGYTGYGDDSDREDESVMGALNGIPGTFTCTMASCEVAFVPEADGVAENTVSMLTGVWKFESTANVESQATQDGDYLYFGYWLRMADDDGNYAFATFSGGRMEFTAAGATGELEGSATYAGKAGGKYVKKGLELVDGQVEPTSATKGQFTADVALTAYFGGNDVSMTKHDTIHGTIKKFMDGDQELDFEVKLESTKFTNTAAFPLTTDDGKASGRHGTVLSTSGSWSGQFFGPGETVNDLATTVDEIKTTYPTGVAGEFDVHFPDAHVAGGYGAHKQ